MGFLDFISDVISESHGVSSRSPMSGQRFPVPRPVPRPVPDPVPDLGTVIVAAFKKVIDLCSDDEPSEGACSVDSDCERAYLTRQAKSQRKEEIRNEMAEIRADACKRIKRKYDVSLEFDSNGLASVSLGHDDVMINEIARLEKDVEELQEIVWKIEKISRR